MRILAYVSLGLLNAGAVVADAASADKAMAAFGAHCFSPFLTAAKADLHLSHPGTHVDFYDLDPFSGAAPSPVTGRAATQGTDRRCEVAFGGDRSTDAKATALSALDREGITLHAELPSQYAPAAGTELLAARRLNPRKIAVVHVGTRPGQNGIETFMNVERMTRSKTRD